MSKFDAHVLYYLLKTFLLGFVAELLHSPPATEELMDLDYSCLLGQAAMQSGLSAGCHGPNFEEL